MKPNAGVDQVSTPGQVIEPAQISPTVPGSDTTPSGESQVQDGQQAQVVEPQQPQVDVEALNSALEEQKKIQKGLDRANTRLQEELKKSSERAAELEAQLGQHQVVTDSDSSVIEDYETRLAEAVADRERWKEQAEAAVSQAERQRVIVDEFPELSWLIPGQAVPQTPDMETFRASLTNIKTRMPGPQSGPPPTPKASPQRSEPGTPVDLDQVSADMMAANNRNDTAEWKRLKAVWDSAAPDALEGIPAR